MTQSVLSFLGRQEVSVIAVLNPGFALECSREFFFFFLNCHLVTEQLDPSVWGNGHTVAEIWYRASSEKQ